MSPVGDKAQSDSTSDSTSASTSASTSDSTQASTSIYHWHCGLRRTIFLGILVCIGVYCMLPAMVMSVMQGVVQAPVHILSYEIITDEPVDTAHTGGQVVAETAATALTAPITADKRIRLFCEYQVEDAQGIYSVLTSQRCDIWGNSIADSVMSAQLMRACAETGDVRVDIRLFFPRCVAYYDPQDPLHSGRVYAVASDLRYRMGNFLIIAPLLYWILFITLTSAWAYYCQRQASTSEQ